MNFWRRKKETPKPNPITDFENMVAQIINDPEIQEPIPEPFEFADKMQVQNFFPPPEPKISSGDPEDVFPKLVKEIKTASRDIHEDIDELCINKLKIFIQISLNILQTSIIQTVSKMMDGFTKNLDNYEQHIPLQYNEFTLSILYKPLELLIQKINKSKFIKCSIETFDDTWSNNTIISVKLDMNKLLLSV